MVAELTGFEGFIFDTSALQVKTIKSKMLDQVRSWRGTEENLEEARKGFKLVGHIGFYMILISLTKTKQLRKIHVQDWRNFLKALYPSITDKEYKESFDYEQLQQLFLS